MSLKYILDDQGNPVPEHDLLRWGDWFKNASNRLIAWDEIGDAVVSTVFLGVDHAGDGAQPILFETMIFGGLHNYHQKQYATRADALTGHVAAVAMASSSTET